MVKVSYLVPLYNKELYIEECIDSILAEENSEIQIEVCIVDDGSTDNSLHIVINKYGNDLRVKIHSFSFNQGKNAACNKAFLMATGDFICLFGADDVVVSNRTYNMLKYYDKKVPKAIYGGIIAKDSNLKNELFRQLPKKQTLYSITMQNGLNGGCVMIPRILMDGIFPIPEHLKFEDWWIAYHLVSSDQVEIMNEYVTFYRIHGYNDCAHNQNISLYDNVKRDYLRHIDYLEALEQKFSDNYYIEKSKDVRKAFFDRSVSNLVYIMPFDIYSVKILLFKIFGAKFIYWLMSLIRAGK